jgi:hypothetical protein
LVASIFIVLAGSLFITLYQKNSKFAHYYKVSIQQVRLHHLSVIFLIGMSSPIFGQSGGPNLFRMETFSEITKDEGISITTEQVDGVNLLRVSAVNPTRPDAAVYFSAIKLIPGEKYTYMISAEPHTKFTIAHFITSDVGNIVWPGSVFINGISVTHFTVPDSASNVTLAFAFQNVQMGDFIFIKDVGLFQGSVPASSWQFKSDEGLQPALQPKKELFEIIAIIVSVIVVVLIILMEKRIPDQSHSVK